jgi:hypothetical protein
MIGSKPLNLAGWKNFAQHATASRVSSVLLLSAFFWIAAAASHSGFMGKWALRDTNRHGYPIEAMLKGTAARPWIYRQLGPLLANFADRTTPSAVKQYLNSRMGDPNDRLSKLGPEATFTRASSAGKPEFRFRYLVVYYLSFLSLFASLFLLRRILLDVGAAGMIATFAPAIFVLALPYLMTIGGYFYDNIELFFMGAAFLLAMRGNMLLLIAITIPATLNKETFIFFLPTLYPLLRCHSSRKTSSITTSVAIVIALVINVMLKLRFSSAPGGVAEFHFGDAIKGYLHPSTYFHPEVTYGIIGPQGAFIGTLALMAIVSVRGLPSCPVYVRRHLAIAAAINFPLLFLFCITGELRNLSLMYVGFIILIGLTLESAVVREEERELDLVTD